jgi:hypothetical protein
MKITKETWRKVFASKLVDIETMELKGYELVENLFVDSSGFGAPDEPAMTSRGEGSQFEREVLALLETHGSLYATITNAGQFQVYVGLFKKTGKSRSKKIANNTLRIELQDGGYAIRFHDTNVLTFSADGKSVKLDSGGYRTRTTKERMSEYLPEGLSITQKNWEWYIYDRKNNSTLPYSDGMTLYLTV